MKKFVVMSSSGQYEDRFSSPIGIYDNRDMAQEFIDSEESWKVKTRELAIRDIEPWEDGYILEKMSIDDFGTELSNYYSELLDKYNDWLWKLATNNKKEEELTEEDYDRYDSYLDDEWFPKFMKELGYDDDVIEATINFNDYDDLSRYNTDYYIYEVNYYPGT